MSGFSFQRTAAEAESIASANGCLVIRPNSDQLFIDLDSKAAIKQFFRLIACFKEHEPCTYKLAPSPSGKRGRMHVVVTLERKVFLLEQLALQAFLGSDQMRELLNWRRMASGVAPEANNLFFEKALPPRVSWLRRTFDSLFAMLRGAPTPTC